MGLSVAKLGQHIHVWALLSVLSVLHLATLNITVLCLQIDQVVSCTVCQAEIYIYLYVCNAHMQKRLFLYGYDFLYNAVSSILDRSKDFKLHPWQICSFQDQFDYFGMYYAMLQFTASKLLTHNSAT